MSLWWSQSKAVPDATGIILLSVGQRRERGLRRRIDRARDTHPSPGRKLDLNRPAADRPDRPARTRRYP